MRLLISQATINTTKGSYEIQVAVDLIRLPKADELTAGTTTLAKSNPKCLPNENCDSKKEITLQSFMFPILPQAVVWARSALYDHWATSHSETDSPRVQDNLLTRPRTILACHSPQ